MDQHDVVVLVPGLFGFDTFGQPPESLSYFEYVALRLAEYTGCSPDRFLVHAPDPTAALQWRVKSLFNFTSQLIAGGHPAGGPIGKVHLIGHSTGGCDIRLLLNDHFCWPGPASAAARRKVTEQVGRAITLSAPLKGTPIARRLRGTMEAAIPLFFALSILGKLELSLTMRNKIVAGAVTALHAVKVQPPEIFETFFPHLMEEIRSTALGRAPFDP